MISYSRQNKYRVYAPPLHWGPWLNAGEHFGEARITVSYKEIADLLVKGRVRYWDYETRKQEIKEFWRATNIHTADVNGTISISFKCLCPAGAMVDAEVSLYGIPELARSTDSQAAAEAIQAIQVIQAAQEIHSKLRDNEWTFEYCIDVGLQLNDAPSANITYISPDEEYAWQYLTMTVKDAVLKPRGDGTQTEVTLRIEVNGKKNAVMKDASGEGGQNVVTVLSEPREVRMEWTETAIFENAPFIGDEGLKTYALDSSFTYSGTSFDKPTFYIEQ